MGQICNRYQLPSYYKLLFPVFVLLLDYVGEWSFTAMLEPVLWTYSLFFVMALSKVSFKEIGTGELRSFAPALLLVAMLISIKNFFVFYLVLLVVVLVLVHWKYVIAHLGNYLKWIGYAALVVLGVNIIDFTICTLYSGDPVFPLLTTNLPQAFTMVWQPEEVAAIKTTVNSTAGGFAAFMPPLILKPFVITFVLCLVACVLLIIGYLRSKDKTTQDNLAIQLWLLLCVIATQALFPDLIRYSYFLVPAFIFGLVYIYRLRGVLWLHACFFLALAAYARPHSLVDATKHYMLPFKAENIQGLDLDRITYSDTDLMEIFAYLRGHKEIDTVTVCELREYKTVLLQYGKTVKGDDLGRYSFKKICSCENSTGYSLVRKSDKYRTEGCNIVFENKSYILYQSRQ